MQKLAQIGNSFRNKTVAAFMLTAVCAVLLCSIPGYRYIREIYLEEAGERTRMLVHIHAASLDSNFTALLALGEPTKASMQYFNEQLSIAGAVTRLDAFIFDANFRLLIRSHTDVHSGGYAETMRLFTTELSSLPRDSVFISEPLKADDGQWYLWGVKRLASGEYFAIRESAERLAKVESVAMIFMQIGLLALCIAIIIGILISKSVTGPVRTLVAYSNEIGKGNYKGDAPRNLSGELGALSEAMTAMKHEIAGNQKERETMLAQIAHEIRNPLGGIELMAGLIKEDMQAAGLPVQHPGRIQQEVARLKELITAFLQYSKPRPALPKMVNLLQIFQQVKDCLTPELDAKAIEMEYQGADEEIYFDPEHLQQILTNICMNSVQAVFKHGRIIVRLVEHQERWIIEITDNGPGIAAGSMSKIFNPFFTGRQDGMGIGLAITKNLVVENKAEITVRNNEDAGCTFTVEKKKIHA